MKLESTLPRRSGFLHFTPVLDVAILLLIFFLLGSNFVLHSGVSVDLPGSTSRLPPVGESHLITVTAGDPPKIYFNEEPISLSELREKISGEDGIRSVIIHGDELSTYGLVFEIGNLVLGSGYEVYLATEPSIGS